jgi:DNA-directed RNA polymerase specialized sigma24 family protein
LSADGPEPPRREGVRFPTTRWTLVRAAGVSEEARRDALEALFSLYWKPVYYYLRRRGLDPARAEDTVQGFFTDLLERGFPSHADPARGRLRSYLRAAMDHYLINQHAKEVAAKRGGGLPVLSIDVPGAERCLASAAADPSEAYEQEWAMAVFARALDRLRGEYFEGGRRGHPGTILRFFEFDAAPSYAEAAAECGMPVGRFKASLHRARVRFRELLREEVAHTTPAEGAVEHEMNDLLRILRR